MGWTDYESDAARCEACKVCDTSRVRKLRGAGNRDAWIAIVGEGPGEAEEEQKANFVGRAGAMLDDCLDAAKLLRSEVWIENAVKGRCIAMVPLLNGTMRRANRKPTMKEIDACRGFLVASMQRLRPRVIVALGDVAITALLGKQLGGVTEQRGRVIATDVLGFPTFIIPSFHPAYALRVPAQKQFIVDDLILAKQTAIANAAPARVPSRITVTRTVGDVEAARDRILKADRMTFDWETYGPVDDNGLHLVSARGFCLSVSIADHEAYVFPRRLQGLAPAWSRDDLRRVDDLLRDIMTSRVPKGGFNVCAFDAPITASTLGKWPLNVVSDIAIANHMLNAHLGERANSLKIAAARYTDLGRYDDELDQWLITNGYTREGKPDKTKVYMVDDAVLHHYSGLDAIAPYLLWPILDERMRQDDVFACYVDQRIPIAREHGEIDRIGVRIDGRRLDAASADLEAGLAMVETQIDALAGHPVNVNSHPQIAKLLFEELGLPIVGRTETGQPATGEEFLMQVADDHEIVGLILQHRTFAKIKGTYVDGKASKNGKPRALKSAVDADGYARMNTRVAGPETLRFATRRPFAIHTFPKPVPRLPNIRALVIPSPGHKFIVNDYGQQEWAIAAILANQTDMIEAILDRGEDVHELVARQLGGIAKENYLDPEHGVKVAGDDAGLRWKSEDDFKTYKKQRSKWKSVNFSILFLSAAPGLAKRLGCTHKPDAKGKPTCDCEIHAANFISEYYEKYSAIQTWQNDTKKYLRDHGHVRTPFGSVRRLPGIFDSNPSAQREAERQGCNAPIQMSGAHVMIRALLAIQSAFRREHFPGYSWARWRRGNPAQWFPGRVVASIHDELICEVHADHLEEGAAIIKACMEAPIPELRDRSLHVGQAIVDSWGG